MEITLSPLMKKILKNANNQLRYALMQSLKQRQINPSVIKVDGKQYLLKLSIS